MDISGLNNYIDSITNIQQTGASENKISGLSQDALKNATDDELMDACKEFEAYFLEQVFKQMEKTTKVFSDEENSDGYSSQLVDYFKDSAITELAGQSTEQQGLGLAQMLYEQMKRNYNL